ncbi:MAG: alpha/beta fold hydrolase [Pseudomonadota bacterium]
MKQDDIETKDMFMTTFDLPPHFLNVARRFMIFGADFNECERVLSTIPSMDQWHTQWSRSGARFEKTALKSHAEGKVATARALYFQSFFSYRLAGFPLLDDTQERRQLYNKAMWAFREGAGLDTLPIDFLEIPFEAKSFPGYLAKPAYTKGQVPVVIYLPGADGWKEDQFFVAVHFLAERGIASIVVDGPGQGESVGVRQMYARPDYEVVVTAILDYLENQPGIDTKRVALIGSSMGGYYAPRAAAFEKRIKAIVCYSAIFDLVEGVFDPYPPIRSRLKEIVGAKTVDEAREQLLAFTLKHIVHQIECPCLIIHGGKDIIIPVSEAHRLFAALKSPKELKIWEDGNHNLLNYYIEARAVMYDWVKDQLK